MGIDLVGSAMFRVVDFLVGLGRTVLEISDVRNS